MKAMTFARALLTRLAYALILPLLQPVLAVAEVGVTGASRQNYIIVRNAISVGEYHLSRRQSHPLDLGQKNGHIFLAA